MRLKVHGMDKLAVVSVKLNASQLEGAANAWSVTASHNGSCPVIGSDSYFDFGIK